MKKLLINQPGRSGDIIICLPIAEWYRYLGYEVHWLCPQEYHSLFKYIHCCGPVLKDSLLYDRVIDLSFGLNTNSEIHKWWVAHREQWQSFVTAKYYLAKVPLTERWKLFWYKNEKQALVLYDKIIDKYGKDYIVAHEKSDNRFAVNISVKNKVLFEPIEDYNVFDWYIVLQNAKEIHCIDSVLCNFVEIIPTLLEKPKFYYDNKNDPQWNKTLLFNNWRFV